LTAACALAGIQAHSADAVEFESSALFYAEPSRVSAFEGVLEGRHEFTGERTGSFKLVYDALTGASASGAVPSRQVQTFTRPSGRGSYTVTPGDTPLDDTFHDTRVAGSGNFSIPLGRLVRVTTGLYGSTEFDYTSLGGNLSVSRDFDRRNTTLKAGVSYSNDSIRPVGGRPIPLASMEPAGRLQPRLRGHGSKRVFDFIAGITQVIDRATLAHLSYSFSDVSGYQTDPYKIVSVVDPLSGDPTDQLFESRPDARAKHILFGKIKRNVGGDVVDVSYRFMSDDWNIVSHTVDLNYRRMIGANRYIQPRVRFYRQSAADFYARWLEDGQLLPAHATADYRLGQFDGWTVGARFGQAIGPNQTFVARLEYYLQAGDSSPPGAPGALADFDLFPTVDAWIVNVGYSIGL
jgi:hypothetical protein